MAANKIALPHELQELIITALYFSVYARPSEMLLDGTGDFQALNGCALVSRAFLRICRRLRFASLQVNESPDVPSGSLSDFVQIFEDPPEGLLEDIPSIASCVRSLNFPITKADATHCHEGLSTAVRKITQLRSLAVSYAGMDDDVISWSAFQSTKLGDAILHLLRLPTFRALVLGEQMSNFPVSMLMGTSIKVLMVQGTTFSCYKDPEEGEDEGVEEEETTPILKEGTPVRLQEFHAINLSGRGITALIHPKEDPWLDISRLKILTMTLDSSPESKAAAQHIFSSMTCPHRLNLSLRQSKSFEGLAEYIKACMDTLTDLRLTMSTNPPPMHTTFYMEEQLSSITAELRSLREAPVNNIKTLVLTLINFTFTDHRSFKISKQWQALDEILVPSGDRGSWGSLEGVFFLTIGCGVKAADFRKLSSCKQIKFEVHSELD